MKKKNTPPRLSHRFFRWFCHPDLVNYIEGDLIELFEERVKEKGASKAKWLFVWDVIKLFRPGIIKPTDGTYRLNNYGMFKNYFKTGYRSMARNRLFTAINVTGLAVSMSVGLLMIAFLSDLLSHDDFHEKRDRIYRLNTLSHQTNGPILNFASSSVKAAYRIKETIPGIEQVTTLRTGFGGDAEVGKSKIPLRALWADNSFLKVFTYPLLSGNSRTALKDPYSLVLTEKSAKKMFGKTDVLGEVVRFDTLNYTVTGVLQDIPKLSHLRFEGLVSFATIELEKFEDRNDFLAWNSIYENYSYLLVPEESKLQIVQAGLDDLAEQENAVLENQTLTLSLQSLKEISIGKSIVNEMGPTIPTSAVWVLIGLTLIVVLSACFNYTNLSIARSLKRSREVGIRKVIGARRGQVIGQFITESVLISLLALIVSFFIFLYLRDQFISLHSFVANLASLELSVELVVYFVLSALLVGIIAGILPAFMFSKIKALQVLKGVSSIRLFQRINMRKSLIVIQFVFSLIFITTTILGYKQYKGFINFDLGFTTENVVNIALQGNNPDILVNKLAAIPAVTEISQSSIIISLGRAQSTQLKYKTPNDSSAVWQNFVNEHYLPLHGHKFLSGNNFNKNSPNEVIVNELLVKRFEIGSGNVEDAIGEVVTLDGKNSVIIGVLKDFNYETVEDAIQPVVIRHSSNPGGYINAKISSTDWSATLMDIEEAWHEVDQVHPIDAKLYNDQIERTYSPFSMIIKVIGFMAFLAICISSMGLFGMVVYNSETKLKEIGIRKVLGAGENNLVFLLGKGFMWLMLLAAGIALPATYILFDKVILTNIAYPQPITLVDVLAGTLGVFTIAILMIGLQTIKAARINPAETLRDD